MNLYVYIFQDSAVEVGCLNINLYVYICQIMSWNLAAVIYMFIYMRI